MVDISGETAMLLGRSPIAHRVAQFLFWNGFFVARNIDV